MSYATADTWLEETVCTKVAWLNKSQKKQVSTCKLGVFICTFAAKHLCQGRKVVPHSKHDSWRLSKPSSLCVCVLHKHREQEQSPGGNQISITAWLPHLG